MIFDLEIPPITLSTRLINIGDNINSSYVPILYINVKDEEYFPGDFISIDRATFIDEYNNIPITMITAPEDTQHFEISSNKILVTHIARFSKITGTKYPIFYKHKINLNNKKIIDKSVIIFDENGYILDRDFYILETDNNIAYIYINPLDNHILHIEWADDSSVHREMLKLEPIFKDLGLNFDIENEQLNRYEMFITEEAGKFYCNTAHSGALLYYTSKSVNGFIMPPVGNMADQWSPLIENFRINKEININDTLVNVNYWMPEYNLQKMLEAQQPGYNSFYKKFTNQKCKIYSKSYIKLQMNPATTKMDDINIYIFDYISNTLQYAFTTNISLIGTSVPNSTIIFGKVIDYSYDGIIKIEKEIDSDIYYANSDYNIDNIYYTFSALDLNSLHFAKSKLIAIYCSWSLLDRDTPAIFYVLIGEDDGKSYNNKFETNGVSFVSQNDYQLFLEYHSALHLTYISIEADKMSEMLDVVYIGSNDKFTFDQKDIASQNISEIIEMIKNQDVALQINDVGYIYVDRDIFDPTDEISNLEYLDFVKDVVDKNIVMSTKTIIDKDSI